MIITAIFCAIVFVIAMVYFSIRLNRYSDEKYDYEPISFLNIFLMMTPFVLIGCVFFIFKSEENQILAIIFSTIIVLGNFLYIKNKTDLYVALSAVFVLIFVGLLFFVALLASSRRDDYYD
ncbi:hypothetical protein PT520_10915 [Aliarcobacter butzleri]|uniref:Uncharacterized protein n=1 Tax=Aliarcobacter butzleri TaxID=28197 RepID=A0AAW6VQD9_9BACT|nr:hypothetical protein [Aliarcobacter butzleri]MDK2063032.1 hypothetical protein [Aliarcobacter butzleri]MDK2070247.1 hypothetical protein [Aliarcobacter butzleri]